jgi:hypothetical protein
MPGVLGVRVLLRGGAHTHQPAREQRSDTQGTGYGK